MKARLFPGYVAGLLALCGCDEPLQQVELVAGVRVLGARVEVQGEPGRAAPAPGDTASVTFLVAAPALSPALGFALFACPAALDGVGRSGCAGEPFAGARSEGTEAERAAPSLTFTTPPELDPTRRLAFIGVVCPAGAPSAEGTRCLDAQPGTSVVLEIELARAGDVNRNPTLQAASLSFDGQAWPDVPAAPGDCRGHGYPEVSSGSTHTLGVALDEADRDPLPRAVSADPPRESLQLSHFTTAGELSQAFDSVSPEDAQLGRTVSFTAPAAPQLVRLWFVVRDFRGGSDFSERAVCVF